MLFVAPKSSQIASFQTNSLIESGKQLIVYCIAIQGDGSGIVTVKEADGVTTILSLQTGGIAVRRTVMNIPFVAKNGLSITTPGTNTCSILYSVIG